MLLLFYLSDGVFTDVTLESGTELPSVKKLGWGCALVDLDNDGPVALMVESP